MLLATNNNWTDINCWLFEVTSDKWKVGIPDLWFFFFFFQKSGCALKISVPCSCCSIFLWIQWEKYLCCKPYFLHWIGLAVKAFQLCWQPDLSDSGFISELLTQERLKSRTCLWHYGMIKADLNGENLVYS